MLQTSAIIYGPKTVISGRNNNFQPLRSVYDISSGRMFGILHGRNGLLFIFRKYTEPQKFGLNQNLPHDDRSEYVPNMV